VSWTDQLPAGLQRLAALGVDVGDTEDVRLDKAIADAEAAGHSDGIATLRKLRNALR